MEQSISELHQKVLFTQVRVKTDKAGGSGTVIYSRDAKVGADPNKFYSTYIITCHHVISDALKIETKWDPVLAQDRKRDVRQSVGVEFFNWKAVPHGKLPLTSGVFADIVAYDADHDMALLNLKLADPPSVASMLPESRIGEVVIMSPVVAVGCALLHDPIVTRGHVTHQGDIIELKDYWMSSAQTIFGNSGGAVFTDGEFQFIGIPSRIDIAGWGSPVTHLGYFSPITRVYEFMKEQVFDFLIPGSTKTEKECESEREDKRKQAAFERAREIIGRSMEGNKPSEGGSGPFVGGRDA